MQIRLINTGKRYNREWIFRHCSLTFHSGKKYAITGPNGSGKSTLLQVIAGAVQHNEGSVEYKSREGKELDAYRHISIAAPYLELIEEMTAKETLEFHAGFKKLVMPVADILQAVGLEKATNKQLRYFSSGMRQRLKLAQAFYSDTGILLLDEPTTNLDAEGIQLYLNLIHSQTAGKIVVVSSNDRQEYGFCDETISISEYKSD